MANPEKDPLETEPTKKLLFTIPTDEEYETDIKPQLPQLDTYRPIAATSPLSKERSFWGDSFWSTAGDVALAPARGLYNAAQSFYSFVDNIGGDWLPDLDTWDARTGIGSFLDSAVQLTAGFGVAGAALKGIGIANQINKLGKLGKFSNYVVSNFVGDTLFYHTDANIARMLKDNQLGSPLTDWLANDEDDEILTTRLKGAVDGLGMSVLTEPVMAGLRAYKTSVYQRKLLQGLLSGNPDKIAKSAEALHKSTKAVHDSLEAGQGGVLKHNIYNRKNAAENDLTGAVFGAHGLNYDEALDFVYTGKKPVQTSNPVWNTVTGDTPIERAVSFSRAGRRDMLNVLSGPSPAAFIRAQENLIREAAIETIETGGKLPENEIARAWENIIDWLGLSPSAQKTFIRRLDAQMPKGVNPDVELAARALSTEALMQHLGADLKRVMKEVGTPKFELDIFEPNGVIKLAATVDKIERAGGFVREFLGMSPHQTRMLTDIPDEVAGLKFGGELKEIRLKDTPLEGVKTPNFSGKRRSTQEAIDFLNAKGGQQKVLSMLTFHKEALLKNDLGALINLGVHHESRAWDMISEWWVNGILSHGQTQIVNLVSNFITSYYRPLETAIGGAITALGPGLISRDIRTEGYKAVKHGIRTLGDLTAGFLDTFGLFGGKAGGATTRRAFMEALQTGESTLLKSGVDHGKIEIGPAITAKTLSDTVGSIPVIGPVANYLSGLADRSLLRGLGAATVDGAGNVVRLPQRLLAAADQLYKQVNFRAKARSLLLDEAESAGMKGLARDSHVANRLNNIMREGQALTVERLQSDAILGVSKKNPNWMANQDAKQRADILNNEIKQLQDLNPGDFDVSQKALSYTKEVTFTDDADSVTQFLKATVTRVPPLRLVMPFITTPVNLLKFAWHRSIDPMIGLPAAAAQSVDSWIRGYGKNVMSAGGPATQASWFKFTKDIMSGDPIRRADALGRAAFAGGIIMLGTTLASNSMNQDATFMIHGRGPHDPNERRLWQESGRLPYSIQIGKPGEKGTQSFQFNRFDPFGSIFGTIADLVTYSHFATTAEQEELGAMTGAVLASIGNNLVNKTYLQGLSDLLEVVNGDNPQKVAQIIRNFSASMMIPNALNSPAFGGEGEDTMREIHSVLDAKMNRTPWGADKLTPQRNLLGETVKRIPQWGEDAIGRWTAFWSPVKHQKDKADPLMNELVRLGHPFRATEDSVTIGGIEVDLKTFRNAKGQTAADRYAELVGAEIDGKSLRKSLEAYIKSDRYKSIPDLGDSDTIQNPKVQAIGQFFSAYRGRARSLLYKEFPDMMTFIKAQADIRKQAYLGAK